MSYASVRVAEKNDPSIPPHSVQVIQPSSGTYVRAITFVVRTQSTFIVEFPVFTSGDEILYERFPACRSQVSRVEELLPDMRLHGYQERVRRKRLAEFSDDEHVLDLMFGSDASIRYTQSIETGDCTTHTDESKTQTMDEYNRI